MRFFHKANLPYDNITYLLESTNIKELKHAKEIMDKRLRFCWAHYSDLASQRHMNIIDLAYRLVYFVLGYSSRYIIIIELKKLI